MRYKDGAGSILPDKGGLLAKMRSETCYDGKKPCPTKPLLIVKAVNPAFPGADGAGLQKSICTADSLLQFTDSLSVIYDG